jgi:hypothetical protein
VAERLFVRPECSCRREWVITQLQSSKDFAVGPAFSI